MRCRDRVAEVTDCLLMIPPTTASYRPLPWSNDALATVFDHVDLPATDAAREVQWAVRIMLEP